MFQLLKSALFRGLLILLPILFLIIILKEFVALIIGLATPIADLLFPASVIESIPQTEILAALLIVITALIIGVVSTLPFAAGAGRFLEQRTVEKLPVYRPLKSLLHALLGSEHSDAFKPALLTNDSGVAEPVYVIEDKGGPRVVVLVPWTPASFAGALKLVPREQLQMLDLTLDQFSLCIAHYGIGMSDLLAEAGDATKETQSPELK